VLQSRNATPKTAVCAYVKPEFQVFPDAQYLNLGTQVSNGVLDIILRPLGGDGDSGDGGRWGSGTPTWGADMKQLSIGRCASIGAFASAFLGAVIAVPTVATADEGGVSFWLPGFFGSLAAAPQQPGWAVTSIYYHTSVSAGADVARAREFETGRIALGATANVSATLDARADLALALPTYTFATPVFGGQLTVGAIGIYGGVNTSLAGSVTGALATPLGTIPFSRFDTISDSVTGFGDVLPIATLRWNAGIHNYMTYITGDIPVGTYDSARLSNVGIGHGAIDAGAGYTYLNPQTGYEFSGVLGFTYNFTNQSTQYQNGVDMHFDWAASQFLTKQFQVGVVGYVYRELGCDSGSGDRVGCFQSQVVGAGPQLGFIIPLTTETQGYLNLKSYWEFANQNRPAGWNGWVTFVISPAEQTPSTSPRRMITK
jgi:hypothetical protein